MHECTKHNAPGAVHGYYRWYVVAVLFIAYVLSHIDRTILSLLIDPIRETLNISDVQVSLLHGLAFAVLYTILGIPIARLADSRNRVRIIASGVALWSVMTALCGLSRSFLSLFAFRAGVGVGEATLSPSAYSIMSDYFSGADLTRALSAYACAIFVGSGLALVVGGSLLEAFSPVTVPLLGELQPWQLVMCIVGLPGVLVAGLILLTVREPERSGLIGGKARSLPVKEVVAFLKGQRTAHFYMGAGFSTLALMWYGTGAWLPTYFSRTFDWSPSVVGLRYGLINIVFGTGGVFFGGALASWLLARGRRDANVLMGVISAVAVFITGVAAPLQSDPTVALILFSAFVFSGSIPWAAFHAAQLQITPNQMRAQVTSLYTFIATIVGLGLGPLVVALITDRLFLDASLLRYSLATMSGIFGPVACFLLIKSLAPFRASLDWHLEPELPAGEAPRSAKPMMQRA